MSGAREHSGFTVMLNISNSDNSTIGLFKLVKIKINSHTNKHNMFNIILNTIANKNAFKSNTRCRQNISPSNSRMRPRRTFTRLR